MKKYLLYLFTAITLLCACTFTVQAAAEDKTPAELPGLTYDHSMELSYAQEFSVDYYNDGYTLITIVDEGQYLLVPEGKEAPEGLDKNITVLQQPLDNIYLVATSAMDLFRAIDGIDNIRLSGTKENGWYIQEAKDAMEAGHMIYAGKYNAPDYELILNKGCDLAIESTMIHHNPEVQEKLEQFQQAYPEAFKANVKMPPMGHYGNAEQEIGRVCVQLAMPDFKFMSGETLTLEGGMGQRP